MLKFTDQMGHDKFQESFKELQQTEAYRKAMYRPKDGDAILDLIAHAFNLGWSEGWETGYSEREEPGCSHD